MSKLNPNAGEFVPSFVTTTVRPPPITTNHQDSQLSNHSTDGAREETPSHRREIADPSAGSRRRASKSVSYTPERLMQIRDSQVFSDSQFVIPDIPDFLRQPMTHHRNQDSQGRSTPQSASAVARSPHPRDTQKTTYSISTLKQFQSKNTQRPANMNDFGIDAQHTRHRSSSAGGGRGHRGETYVQGGSQRSRRERRDKSPHTQGRRGSVNGTQFVPAFITLGGPFLIPPEAVVGGVRRRLRHSGERQVEDPALLAEAREKVSSILLDLNEGNADTLHKQFVSVRIPTPGCLDTVVRVIFDRAMADPVNSNLYAQVCLKLVDVLPDFHIEGRTEDFRRLLVARCYESLRADLLPATRPLPHLSTSSKNASLDSSIELEESTFNGGPESKAAINDRCHRILRTIVFIGEVYKRHLLTEHIIHLCLGSLLGDTEYPRTKVLEAACRLLHLVGDLLDSTPGSRQLLDSYCSLLQETLQDEQQQGLPTRLSTLIKQTLSLRKAGWVRRPVIEITYPPASQPTANNAES